MDFEEVRWLIFDNPENKLHSSSRCRSICFHASSILIPECAARRIFPSPANPVNCRGGRGIFLYHRFPFGSEASCPVSSYCGPIQRSMFFASLSTLTIQAVSVPVSSWKLPFGVPLDLPTRLSLAPRGLCLYSRLVTVFSFYGVPVSTFRVQRTARLMQPLSVGLVHFLSEGHFFLRSLYDILSCCVPVMRFARLLLLCLCCYVQHNKRA
jgi:hypothetical protein